MGDIKSVSATVQLNDGHVMPRLGLGTFQGSYNVSDSVVTDAVKRAIGLGFRHIDTASLYHTEGAIGISIRDKINDGTVTRDELYITTKLWCTAHRKDHVVPALRKSLALLGLSYVDLYLVHWPMALKPSEEEFPEDSEGKLIFEDDITDITDTWKGMIECKQLGLAKSIGVSNFNEKQLKRILDLGLIPPANNQIEVNPYFLNENLVNFCKSKNIQVSCFSPLHKPYRAWAKPGDPFIATDETLISIGKKYQKTPQQVALRFQLQRDLVVIPKSNSDEHLRENLGIFEFELSEQEMESIRVNCGRHNLRVLTFFERFGTSKEFPFEEFKTSTAT